MSYGYIVKGLWMTTKNQLSPPLQNTKQLWKESKWVRLSPDGVPITVNWDKLDVGMSFFVPAINLSKLDKEVERIAKKLGIKIESRQRIENGKLGMRFWRIL